MRHRRKPVVALVLPGFRRRRPARSSTVPTLPVIPARTLTMSRHVTVAVVGAGMAGQAHAFGYRNATMHPALAGVDIELAAIVDPNQALAQSVGDRYGFARAVSDLDVHRGRRLDRRGQPRPSQLRLPVPSSLSSSPSGSTCSR